MTDDRSASPVTGTGNTAMSAALAPEQLQPARCIHHWIEWQAAARPDAVAVSFDGQQVSYDELNHQANQLAHELIANGVKPDDIVGLCIHRSTDLIVSLLGILKAGAAYLPLDPDYPAARLAHMVNEASPSVIVSHSAANQRLPEHSAVLLNVDTIDLASNSRPANNPDVGTGPDNLCYVIFTSGSTGLPKGVMVTHENVVRLFESIRERVEFKNDDVWTLFHSCAFGFSVWEIFGALLHGAELVVVPDQTRKDPQALHQLLQSSGATVLSQTPSAFRQLLLNPAFADSNTELKLRSIVFSGEAVVREDLDNWYDVHGDSGPQLINTYAITETGGQVAVRSYSAAADDRSAGNVGLPLADTPVYLLDENLKPVDAGQPGELCVGGPGVTRGYLNQPELTAKSFIEYGNNGRIYRTGDQARLLPSGELEFLGRKDAQIKIRGYRVELGEIETVLREHASIREAAVMLRNDPGSEARLVAYIVGNDLNVSDLREHIGNKLPEYMVPAAFVTLDELPLNPNGKLDRAALPAPGNDRPALAVAYTAPETALEQALAPTWSTALGISPVGIDDNFFELGGDSILALKLTSALREQLGEYIYISALIEAPTIRTLSAWLKEQHPAAVASLEAGDKPESSFDESLPQAVANPAQLHDVFPLTDIQQAYFVGRSNDFALGGVATHLYIEVDTSNLDMKRFADAWQKVIDRHEMLRAIVLPDGTQQILSDVPPYDIPLQDLRGQDDSATEAGLQTVRERLSHQVIPSDRWPLFELAVSHFGNNQSRLHISLDCLITDARSFQIMSSELVAFYNNPDAVLPLPDINFRDYVIAEEQLNDSAFYQRALDYWIAQLDTMPGMPQLPLAVEPELLTDHKFVQRSFELPKADWDRFQERASRAGITPTAALLQCFGEVLAAWSRSPRLTLNLTLFNRMPLHPDIDDVVGDFTSLILLGVDATRGDSFEARAQQLQTELWHGVDNRFVSGVRVLREMARAGSKNGENVQAAMPVVFTSTLGIGASGEDASSWHHFGEQVFAVSQTPQVWLDHVASERNGGLLATWDAVEALFPADMLDEMFTVYSKFITELASNESAWNRGWANTLDTLVPEQHAKLIAETNDTEGPLPNQLLHAGFADQAGKRPDAPAIISSERCLTYSELDRLSNQLANRLNEYGVQTNELVAVVMQKGWEQIVAVLGILKAGAAYMPVDASMPAERLHYLLEHGQVNIAVTQGCQDAAIDWPQNIKRIRINDTDLGSAPATAPLCPATLSDLAYVIFTSGSTGQPKGVVIDHRGAANTCADINDRFDVTANDSVLALSSLSFDLSVYDIFGLLAAGGRIVIPDAAGMRDPSHWANLVKQNQITLWNTVPALMDLVTDYAEQQPRSPISSLRVSMMSGDWIPVKLPDRIRSQCPLAEVISMGGATEASIWSIIYPVGIVPDDWVSIPYGKPLRNQTFHVLNSELADCPPWVPGELYIGGIGVAVGYWRDDVKTNASFITHPRTGERLYRTGDLGRYLPDGNIEFMGREDFQVKVQGFRVELGDIEAALESHKQIRNTVVTAVGPERGNKRLVAYMVAEGSAPGVDELRHFLGDKLPEYMVPAAYVFMDTLPLTANGKIDRKGLPEPDMNEQSNETGTATGPANDGTNPQISKLVCEVLGMTELDPTENLLQMGATSIEMIRIANALDQHMGFRPRMDDFYRDPSVNGLSDLCGDSSPAAANVEDIDDPLLTHPSVLKAVTPVTDPDDRAAYKATLPGIRKDGVDAVSIDLNNNYAIDEAGYLEHRSYRQFKTTPLALSKLSLLLSHLRSRDIYDRPKYLYGSAGGLYPIQTYIYIKPDRIEGIDAGFYYYQPMENRLVLINKDPGDVRELYDPIINRPVFDESAFAIYLVAEMQAIGGMYAERSLHYSVIETGSMTQLLESAAPAQNIGLCQVGGLETKYFTDVLGLSDTHILLHALLGGEIDEAREAAAAAAFANQSTDDLTDDEERDEGEI